MEPGKKKKSKKPVIITLLLLLIAGGAFYYLYFVRGKGGEKKPQGRLCYVESVANIVNTGNLGRDNRFMGIVESQEIKGVEKDSSKPIKDIFVKVGDNVKEGDQLFSYDTDEMELQLQQLELDRQGINNRINSAAASIDDLTKQRRNATSEDERLSLTSQINSYNASINEEKYNLSMKELEIEKQKEAIQSAIVYAPMSGVIKSINEKNDNNGYQQGQSSAFINIMADGDFRIKGTVTEQNVYSLSMGTPVIIRSRIDESKIWHGVIAKIDLEPQQNNQESGYYVSAGGGDSASKYSFYVTPDTTEGLILGQHLFIELDYGQGEVKEGLYVPSYYFIVEEDGYYVWKQDNDHITKAKVTVGEYDEATMGYQILEGLTEEDYIAFPDPSIEEGNPTTTNYDDVINQLEDNTDGSGQEDYDGSGKDEYYDGSGKDDYIDDFNVDDNEYVVPDNAVPDNGGDLYPSENDLSNGVSDGVSNGASDGVDTPATVEETTGQDSMGGIMPDEQGE